LEFKATVIPSGNATAIEVPEQIAKALGSEARPPVKIAINGHSWRSRIALMRGQRLVGVSAANRAAAGVGLGDVVAVDLERDEAPREVEEPADLAGALNARPGARAAFDRLPFGLRRMHVASVIDARSPEVRLRRIDKLVASLS